MSLNCGETVLEAKDIKDLLHTTKEDETKPRMIDQEITGGDDFRTVKSKLNPPKRSPTDQERRKLIGILMGWLVEYIMTHFLYTFGGADLKQEDGGPTGDEATQAVARIVGDEFDEIFGEMMISLELKNELYSRYVDDIDLMMRSIGRRVKFCPLAGAMVEKTYDEMKADETKQEDEITMEELRKVADTCIDMLKTEADCPSRHPELGFKVPILDMSVWLEQVPLAAPGLEDSHGRIHSRCQDSNNCLPIGVDEARRVATETNPAKRMVTQVCFEFYRKPMAPNRVMLAESAQSWQQKRTTATQELIRRLLNTKKELNCRLKQTILNRYMELLKNSGYDEKFRKEILQSGIAGYNKILEADWSGKRPMYRSKAWRQSAQGMEDQKVRKSKKWLGDTFKSHIFIPPTPGSELQKLMQAKEKELRAGGRENFPIKIIETAGKPLERILVKTDPFKGNGCSDLKCIPNRNPKTQ